MINKLTLQSAINKYHLGEIESVKWTVKDNTLSVDFMSLNKEIIGKLTYNNLFQFMDLIGDYWLELIEQVIPSTTIMEGCENSGKVYRNTIFDKVI